MPEPTPTPEPVGAAPAPPPNQAKAAAPATRSKWSLAAVAAAGGFVAVALLFVFRTPPATRTARSTNDGDHAQAAVDRPRTASPVIAAPPAAPAWVGRKQARWGRDGSKTISFASPARNDVAVWMTRVRPSLVVRCLSHATEVFVETGAAASIEPLDGVHTVRVQIDDGPEEVQQWSDSVSQQELFAPDGVGLARRLARSHRLRFGFTPYNAKPVVADFAVEGFDELAGLVASTCGWRLDDPAATTARR